MGHLRISSLPKTQRWLDIFRQIAEMPASETEIAVIARKTIQNIRSRFRQMIHDNSVEGAFEFLVNLAIASREEDPRGWLLDTGIELPENPTPFSFAKAYSAWITVKTGSQEYSEIVQQATADAIAKWYHQNQPTMPSLFKSLEDPFEVWRNAGNGAGFCELSRTFFAELTQRYLGYFLERGASVALKDINDRVEFSLRLREHVEAISLYAFETAKITQSFSAGWFNKYAKESVPSEKNIKQFLSHALEKMCDELQQEGEEE